MSLNQHQESAESRQKFNNPMVMGENPNTDDAVFRAAEWLVPKLRDMERRESK